MKNDILIITPKREPNIILNEEGDVYSLLDSRSGKIFITNKVGKRVWELCDGKRTLQEIIKIIKREFGTVSEETVRQDVLNFLEQCRSKNILI